MKTKIRKRGNPKDSFGDTFGWNSNKWFKPGNVSHQEYGRAEICWHQHYCRHVETEFHKQPLMSSATYFEPTILKEFLKYFYSNTYWLTKYKKFVDASLTWMSAHTNGVTWPTCRVCKSEDTDHWIVPTMSVSCVSLCRCLSSEHVIYVYWWELVTTAT